MVTAQLGTKFKLTDNKLFRIEEHPYRVIEVQVDNRMRERNYTELVNVIHSLMKGINKRIVCNKDGIVYTRCQPVSFEILYNSNKEITFNFAVNELDSLYFYSRLQAILPNSTLKFRNDYINEFKNSNVYKYDYEKHYMLSLKTNVSPISSLLAVKKDLDNEEKLLIQTLILPLDDGWKNNCYDNWKKIKKGQDVTNNSARISIANWGIDFLNSWFEVLDQILGTKPKTEKTDETFAKKLFNDFDSESRVTKLNNDGYKVNIKSFIKTKSIMQSNNLAKGIETCYKDLYLDNDLVIGKRSVVCELDLKRRIPFFSKTIMSTAEIANFIKLPDNILQKRFNIKSIKINQVDVPTECKKGFIKLGEYEYHSDLVSWYLPTDRDIQCLPLMMITKQGGGKTTLQLNIANDTVKNKQGLVAVDYVRNNQLAQALIKLFPDIQVIKFDNPEDLDNFSFPEIEIDESAIPYIRKKDADKISTEIEYMIDSMATDSEPLTRPMKKILNAACHVVFVYKDKTLLDVMNVLEEKDIRNEFIQRCVTDGIYTENDRLIKDLKKLDDKVESATMNRLFDRISVITDSTLLTEMLESRTSKVNFLDIMDNSKPVVIVMPQSEFTNNRMKDILCTYYMSRVRLAMYRRKEFNKVCRVIIDEVHQIPNTMNLITQTIAEPRKFAINYVLSMHYLEQVSKDLQKAIVSVGFNFMLLKGITESGFAEFKWAIGDEFEYEDMKEMDYDYGSLNIINVGNGDKVFMSKLPDALRDEKGNLYIGDDKKK